MSLSDNTSNIIIGLCDAYCKQAESCMEYCAEVKAVRYTLDNMVTDLIIALPRRGVGLMSDPTVILSVHTNKARVH
jgi:hypothetical protein